MNAVVIDSSAERLALAVIKGDTRYTHIGNIGARRHTSEILSELDKLFVSAGITPADVGVVGVVVGPGSFTGIRIGVATANAMAMATGAKVVEITALEVLVSGYERALGLIDCKHGNFYALYKDGTSMEYKAIDTPARNEYEGTKVLYTEPDLDAIIGVFEEKASRGEYVATAKPFYLKPSSAETESRK